MKTLKIELPDDYHNSPQIIVKGKWQESDTWRILAIFFDRFESNVYIERVKEMAPDYMIRTDTKEVIKLSGIGR